MKIVGLSGSNVAVNLGSNTASEAFRVLDNSSNEKLGVTGDARPMRITSSGVDVNVSGAFYFSQAVSPGMKATRSGRISADRRPTAAASWVGLAPRGPKSGS